ncbi:MAG TPA: hypothetical protein VHL58_07905 [Thermoanaerobaculia bacterium]|nr:hypothetical protein [Thermoanaerobaculia bacterium]
MTSILTPGTKQGHAPDWNSLVTESFKAHGLWPTYAKLIKARDEFPEDLVLRGYIEIIRTSIVRDLLEHPKGLQAVPRLSAEFLTDFGRFNLTAQEGFLVSLIDGRLVFQQLLRLSPFDTFTTLFHLAHLQNQKAITIPS